jgi:hypothetical protein
MNEEEFRKRDLRGVRSMLKDAMTDDELLKQAEKSITEIVIDDLKDPIRNVRVENGQIVCDIVGLSPEAIAKIHGVCEATMQLRLSEMFPVPQGLSRSDAI